MCNAYYNLSDLSKMLEDSSVYKGNISTDSGVTCVFFEALNEAIKL
jgi:hypothetical protein